MRSFSKKWLGFQTLACLGVLLGLAVAYPAAQQPATLSALLARSGDYAADFVTRFSNVIAEEHYVQTVTSPPGTVDRQGQDSLRAEFLLARAAKDQRWAHFHDVFELNGHAVQRPAGRLTTLLNPASEERILQANNLMIAGAREERLTRRIANPVLPLAFLQPEGQPQFRFSLGKLGDVGGIAAVIVTFATREPTRGGTARPEGSDLFIWGDTVRFPVSGRLWIEPDTGRVLKAEWSIGPDTVVTIFKFDPAFGLAVPVEMREEYPFGPTLQPGSSFLTVSSLVGTATYGPFHAFGT